MQTYAPEILKKLTLEQLEEAMYCLHHDLYPQDKLLQSLQLPQWNELANLLQLLLRERRSSNLH